MNCRTLRCVEYGNPYRWDSLMKIFYAALFACVVSQVNAQQIASPVSSIRVSGEAIATAKPERAQIDVGVLTQEKLSQPAASQNAKLLDAVMSALHKLLGPDADIKTINYSLSPEYQYRALGGKPAVSGYTVLNVLRIRVDDLEKVGSVIDTATQAGANHVESVQFTVRDPDALRSQALREAASKARADADALAAALNLKIVRVLSVEESRDVALPPNEVTDTDSRGPPGGDSTPNQPGLATVTANVTLTVEVSPR
jgi:uncharacterized protein YggE